MKMLTVSRYFAILLATALFLTGSGHIVLAFTGQNTGTQSTQNDHSSKALATNLGNQTQSLVALAKRYEKADADQKQALLTRMILLARERQQKLARLMEQDPGAALRVALPEAVRINMPAEILAMVERETETEGTLEVRYEDYEDRHVLRHALVVNNKRYALQFAGQAPNLATGERLHLKGLLLQDSIVVDPEDANLNTLELGGDGSANTANASAIPLTETTGERRTLVLLANFQNVQDEPYTVNEAYDLVFGTVNDYYMENSSGQTWLTGEVHGWYTLPFDQPTDSYTCKTSEISKYAQQAAMDAGVDLSAFDHLIYVFPQTSCFASGTGTVGGQPSESWINGNWFKLKTVGHEFGHNLGLFHSGAEDCGDTTLGGSCQTFVYGDTMDIMGNQSVGHFNAFQKERLGWLDGSQGQVGVADTTGTFTLSAYENNDSSSPKAVKVYKSTSAGTSEKNWYYIEYRQAIGFDDFLATTPNVLNGIVIRKVNDSDPASSRLLDMTPNSTSGWDWGDPALEFGQTFTDPETGLTISSQAGSGGTVLVDINYGTPVCSATAPSVSINPPQSEWVPPGTPVSYTVTVTNTDSVACSTSTYDLSARIPAGWSALYGSGSLYLDPGQTGTVQLEVTSPPTAADGFFTIETVASSSVNSAYQGTAQATQVISALEENAAPIAVDDTAETAQGTSVMIDLLNNDSDPDNDQLSVISATQGSAGSVSIDENGRATYTPKRKAKGVDSFTYTITDGTDTSSATVQVSIIASVKSTGGNGKGKNK